MTILVTGGAGYIGSHTCLELLNAGYEVVVIDNFLNSKMEALKRVQELTGKRLFIYKADLLDQKSLEHVFDRHRIQAVIHFAGLKAVGESTKIPLHYYVQNMTSTFQLCKTMDKYGVRNLVFSSSATVYGKPKATPITEESPLQPTNPYGRTKWMVEEMLRDLYAADFRWSIALLRYFNPVGAHKSGDIGEDPQGVPNNLMPFMTQVAVGKLARLNIFGKDYDTPDGTGVRDYIHVVDLALGHLHALDKIQSQTGVEAYNLGTGKGVSVLEMVTAFQQTTNSAVPYMFTDRRPGDVASCYADVSKANAELNWYAQKNIRDMCRDAWHWQLRHPNGYESGKLAVSEVT